MRKGIIKKHTILAGKLRWLVLVLLVLLAFVVIVIRSNSNKGKAITDNSPSSTTVVYPIDDINDGVYVNHKYKFTFEYPNEVFIVQSKPKVTETSSDEFWYSSEPDSNSARPEKPWLRLSVNGMWLSKDRLAHDFNQFFDQPIGVFSPETGVTKIRELPVYKGRGMVFTVENKGKTDVPLVSYPAAWIKGEDTIWLTLNMDEEYKDGKYKKIFNSIVNSFQFFDNPSPQVEKVTSSQVVTYAPTPSPRISKATTLPHEYLPGFDIKYSSEWKSTFKQFYTKDNVGFETRYFPECHEGCMGIKISKDNYSLNFVFDLVLDNNGEECHEEGSYTAIGDNWYRIKDIKGYYYVYPGNQSFFKDNETGKTKLCESPSGTDLKEHSPSQDYGILMEWPYTRGNVNNESLKEIDNIILSTKGIRQL